MSIDTRFYHQLSNDDRLDMRMPVLLKQHADRCARARGESLSQYIIEAIAARVCEELPQTGSVQLSATEQAHFISALARSAPPSRQLKAAKKRATELFGADAG
jgi:uncharacterized protein (DUF1778 family)